MQFVSLASGSGGNASLVSTGKTNILIDCGIAAKRIDESLRSLGLGIESIDAVLLTHEHSDHIKGLKRLMAGYGKPVYASAGTLNALSKAGGDEYFSYSGRGLMEPVYRDRAFRIGDIDILPFGIYHDAAEPLGYRLEVFQEEGEAADSGLRKHVQLAVMTDCGHFDDYLVDHLKYLDTMLLEANHDRGMLANGPYPVYLKRRIMSRDGHLSNNSAGQLLSEILGPRLKHVLLGHLSEHNNTHRIAVDTVREELRAALGDFAADGISLEVAEQDSVSGVVRL